MAVIAARATSPGRYRANAVWQREHLSGARTHADRLWTLMMLELWMREYLDDRGRWSLR